jgi:hypothetical protein
MPSLGDFASHKTWSGYRRLIRLQSRSMREFLLLAMSFIL